MVLEITDQPGPLISKKAPLPRPGESLVLHSFLSATAFVPEHEDILRRALDSSGSLTDYLTKLRSIGFEVVEAE
jgi:hypothetical protein